MHKHCIHWDMQEILTCSTLGGSSSLSTVLVRRSMKRLQIFISSFIRCMPSSTCMTVTRQTATLKKAVLPQHM